MNISFFSTTQREKEQSATLRECLHKLGDAVVYMKKLSDEQFRRSDALIQQQNQVNALAARSRELENSLNQVKCSHPQPEVDLPPPLLMLFLCCV